MEILFTGPLPEWAETELTGLGHQVTSVAADAYVDEGAFKSAIPNYDVYVSGGLETCTADVIEAGEKLKAIIFLGVDPSNYIDCPKAAEKNIPVLKTPGANANAVAELTLWHMLSAASKTARMQNDMAAKTWKNQTGYELRGKKLGLVGSGPIARTVAEIAKGFGMDVAYWTRSGPKESMAGQHHPLDAVIKESDIVSLHVPKDAGQIINTETISSMKKGATIINTAPASLVDCNALYQALDDGQLSFAAFDCFYKEGDDCWNADEAKLLSLGPDLFQLTPHAGWRTKEADDNMFTMAINHIKKLHN